MVHRVHGSLLVDAIVHARYHPHKVDGSSRTASGEPRMPVTAGSEKRRRPHVDALLLKFRDKKASSQTARTRRKWPDPVSSDLAFIIYRLNALGIMGR
jgi:hypothetical protein